MTVRIAKYSQPDAVLAARRRRSPEMRENDLDDSMDYTAPAAPRFVPSRAISNATGSAPPRDIAFLFVGGIRQALYLAPLAAELARQADVRVTAYAMDARDARAIRYLLAGLGSPSITIHVLTLPHGVEWMFRKYGEKEARLLRWRSRLLRHDALVAAEGSSTILKSLPGPKPYLIHVPHGAADRANAFDKRIARFDHVVTAGDKDRRRLIGQGLVTADRCTVSGSLKVAGVKRMVPLRPERCFNDDRPIILYNPHYDARFSSWDRFGWDLTDAILATGQYNLIVAPHVRLAERLSAEEKKRWFDRPAADNLLVDFGSPRSIDMSYSRSADVYLGDISSQVYEFLIEPRPVLFIDAHRADWKNDPDYMMWRYGAITRSVDEILIKLTRASAVHARFRTIQIQAVADALGPIDGAAERAALQILQRLPALATA